MLDKATFNSFRMIAYEKGGIALGDNKEALVNTRVSKRMRELRIEDPRVYLDLLMRDASGNELVKFLDCITTNLTSFFREAHHFDLLRDHARECLQRGQKRFRFWSAACSSGEEPYSMAITLAEALDGVGADVRILATDLSTKVLDRARAGIYASEQVDKVPKGMRNRLFEPTPDGRLQVRQGLKSVVAFKRLNLATPPYPMSGPLDVIFCRNVLIYFDNLIRARLLADMYRLLKPGGLLLVGHAEGLTGMVSDFKSVKPTVYRKPS